MLSWPAKDPREILDYQLDWSARVTNDTIAASDWSVPDGITMRKSMYSHKTTTIWLEGGAAGETYVLVNHIDTDGGRRMEQSVKLKIQYK